MRNFQAFLLAFFLVGQAAWAGPQDFKLFNRTGVDIYAVYVSPSDVEEWQENLIEGAQVLNGADIDVEFAPDEEVEMWDIRVEDQEGNFLYWRDINLLEAYEIIIEDDGKARIKGAED